MSDHQCVDRPAECEAAPLAAPAGGCTCGERDVCSEGWLCSPSGPQCVPPPCLPHPWLADSLTCSCNLPGLTLTPEVCQEGQLCHTACITPLYCPDPTNTSDWTSSNLQLTDLTNNTFIQWSSLEVECLDHMFTSDLEGGFTAMCGEEGGGTWNLSSCSYPVCSEVEVDTGTVEVTELLITANATTHGSILKFSCKDEAEVFSVGSGLTRLQAVCNRR